MCATKLVKTTAEWCCIALNLSGVCFKTTWYLHCVWKGQHLAGQMSKCRVSKSGICITI